MSFVNNATSSTDSRLRQNLLKAIEVTVNSIWSEGNRTKEKIDVYPEILKFKINIVG
jgi:hypothetical protein